MGAIELRERAAALFGEAKTLVGDKAVEELNDEQWTAYQAKMKEATDADAEYVKAAERAGSGETLRERLDYYATKATGSPIPWSRMQLANDQVLARKSLGQAFVESDVYKELTGSGVLDSDRASFKTAPFHPEIKAASDIISGTAATSGDRAGGGAGLITPDYLPGILPLPQQPTVVRDLFSQGTTQSDQLSYAAQSSFDNAAAAVSEAAVDGNPTGAKPQSSIGWTRRTDNIETIATWMAATRKQLSDAGQTRSLIDNQLRLMLDLEIDDQLMNGDGTSPNISGLLDRSGLQTLDGAAHFASTANIDLIRTAKRLVRTGIARANADAVVMHPEDSEEFDLMKDDFGRYRAGDPFGVQAPTGESAPIWRLRRVESEAVDPGTAIVGAFKQGGTVFEREGVTILTSDSHSDFFVRNLIAVLAETRLGLAVFFPAAFVVVTLKPWDQGS